MASLTASLLTKSGEKIEFSHSAGGDVSSSDRKTLIETLRKLQTEVNDKLTMLVNQETAAEATTQITGGFNSLFQKRYLFCIC